MSSPISIGVLALMASLAVMSYAQLDGNPTEEEVDICKRAASNNGTTLEKAVKEQRLSCEILCQFTNGISTKENSPDGQMCCEIVGGGPTGFCKDGKCPIGGILG